jgi:NhaP-type Na+/H+ and K+/H+ antiporter
LPGLLILILTCASIIYNEFIQENQFGLTGVWQILGFMLFGLIAEINQKHNFEIVLFFISFAVALTVFMQNGNPRDDVVS